MSASILSWLPELKPNLVKPGKGATFLGDALLQALPEGCRFTGTRHPIENEAASLRDHCKFGWQASVGLEEESPALASRTTKPCSWAMLLVVR